MPRLGVCLIAVFFSIAAAGSALSQSPATTNSWNSVGDDFIDQYFAFNPSLATSAGIHTHDSELEDYSGPAVAEQIAWFRQFEKRVLACDAKNLNATDAADREILANTIRANLLALEVIRLWQKDPDRYSSGAADSIYVIMSRRFASPDERLRSVIAREKLFPHWFANARANLRDVPRVFTEIALEQLPGTIAFFEKDVPAAFADARDPAVKSAFAESNAAAIKLLREYQQWLKSDLLPRSNGDFRIGADAFSKKLAYEEMVTTPLDRLLEIGLADLHKNQAEFQRVAKEIDPSRSPSEVLAELQSMHPAPGELMQRFRDTFDGLISFIKQHYIVTLPSDRRPTLQETRPLSVPPPQRPWTLPGPLKRRRPKPISMSRFRSPAPRRKKSPD